MGLRARAVNPEPEFADTVAFTHFHMLLDGVPQHVYHQLTHGRVNWHADKVPHHNVNNAVALNTCAPPRT